MNIMQMGLDVQAEIVKANQEREQEDRDRLKAKYPPEPKHRSKDDVAMDEAGHKPSDFL